jgi:hypothetical protein
VPDDVSPELEAQFNDFCENPFKETYSHRVLVAHAAGVLAGGNPAALEVLLERARSYAALQQSIGDANPYDPNSIRILAEVPPCEKVTALLREIATRYPGMAQGDAVATLAALGVSLKLGVARRLKSGRWGTPPDAV